jgi:hypothetical protein
MNEELISVLREFGVMGLWGFILYNLFDMVKWFGSWLMLVWSIHFLFKKGWPGFKWMISDTDFFEENK